MTPFEYISRLRVVLVDNFPTKMSSITGLGSRWIVNFPQIDFITVLQSVQDMLTAMSNGLKFNNKVYQFFPGFDYTVGVEPPVAPLSYEDFRKSARTFIVRGNWQMTDGSCVPNAYSCQYTPTQDALITIPKHEPSVFAQTVLYQGMYLTGYWKYCATPFESELQKQKVIETKPGKLSFGNWVCARRTYTTRGTNVFPWKSMAVDEITNPVNFARALEEYAIYADSYYELTPGMEYQFLSGSNPPMSYSDFRAYPRSFFPWENKGKNPFDAIPSCAADIPGNIFTGMAPVPAISASEDVAVTEIYKKLHYEQIYLKGVLCPAWDEATAQAAVAAKKADGSYINMEAPLPVAKRYPVLLNEPDFSVELNWPVVEKQFSDMRGPDEVTDAVKLGAASIFIALAVSYLLTRDSWPRRKK